MFQFFVLCSIWWIAIDYESLSVYDCMEVHFIHSGWIHLFGLNTEVSMRSSTLVPEAEGIFKWPIVRPWVDQQIIMAMARLGRDLSLHILLVPMCPLQPNHSPAWQQTLFIQTLIHNWLPHLSHHLKSVSWPELLVEPDCHHWVLLVVFALLWGSGMWHGEWVLSCQLCYVWPVISCDLKSSWLLVLPNTQKAQAIQSFFFPLSSSECKLLYCFIISWN